MPISWNEIRHNAIRFAHDWASATREDAEAKTFWDEFFSVFGIRRRVVASFEEPVKRITGDYGYIDLFWSRVLLVEHKSRGKNLGKAESQAFRYIQDLARSGRMDEIPRYVIVSDFGRIALHDLEPEEQRDLPLFDRWRVQTIEFGLADFHKNIHAFAFIPGYKQHKFEDQDPINLKAVEILGHLHDALEAGGYTGHELERFLVRILFCLFAEDTGIFEREAFYLYLDNHTKEDGSDLGLHLARLFEVLNTPEDRRQANLDEELAQFRYVNGDLFSEKLDFADFNRDMRNALIACTRFDWSRISPAIFGSLFQSVMEPKERRQTGGHYTSERDILKVVRSLFLDELRVEFDHAKKNKAELRRFQEKLAGLHFLDPACGCGNFLVITYRELRQLEIELLKDLHGGDQRELDIAHLSRIDVDQFYGIEIAEWPARIAEVAMWLMDHQMNLQLAQAFGQYFVRLPLKKSPTIVCGNALRLDWKQILPPEKCRYVLGNPPFVGQTYRTDDQSQEVRDIFGSIKRVNSIDYVACWYVKAVDYMLNNPAIRGAYVSTNSITQGEQVEPIWQALQSRGLHIHFAHRTFRWESEARGKAHVHVVIIGFGLLDKWPKLLYDYSSDGTCIVSAARHINPYLVDAPNILVTSRGSPVSNVPRLTKGNQPSDGGFLVLTDDEKHDLISKEPTSAQYIRPYIGSEEFINGKCRHCLWLKDVNPAELKKCSFVLERIQRVREFRLSSSAKPTREKADTPQLFFFISQPQSNYLVIPEVSSEKRRYIPIGFVPPVVISSNKLWVLPDANIFHFGVLTSSMHMSWMRQVTGRLEMRYQYSGGVVYNNYPWPENPTEKQRTGVETAAQSVLDVRKEFPDATLADLYDPLTMPPKLVEAHAELDCAVDRCYRSQPFTNERQRVEFLFGLYEKLAVPLLPATSKKRRGAKKGRDDASRSRSAIKER